MKKELKKGEITVEITDKSREKVRCILGMFGEKVYSENTLLGYRHIGFCDYSDKWRVRINHVNETLVKPKRLKAILANEKLKAGDYVVLGKGTIVVKVDGFSNGLFSVKKGIFKKTLSKSPVFNFVAEEFKRYATKEEIELLEGEVKEELQVGKWYKYKYKLGEKDGYLLFNFNGTISQDSQYGFTHTSHGQDFTNNISIYEEHVGEYTLAARQEVKEAFIKESKRRYKFGDKVKSLSSSNLECVLNFEFIDYYESDDLWISNESTMTCVYRNGKWATVIEVDKLAELKEAHKNGSVIECLQVDGTWYEIEKPQWNDYSEYRIKPEEPIKVGDVCKLWDDDDDSVYEVGSVLSIDNNAFPYMSTSGIPYANAKKLTKEEAIDLLFNNK